MDYLTPETIARLDAANHMKRFDQLTLDQGEIKECKVHTCKDAAGNLYFVTPYIIDGKLKFNEFACSAELCKIIKAFADSKYLYFDGSKILYGPFCDKRGLDEAICKALGWA